MSRCKGTGFAETRPRLNPGLGPDRSSPELPARYGVCELPARHIGPCHYQTRTWIAARTVVRSVVAVAVLAVPVILVALANRLAAITP